MFLRYFFFLLLGFIITFIHGSNKTESILKTDLTWKLIILSLLRLEEHIFELLDHRRVNYLH